MKLEFERYRLVELRILTGLLQILVSLVLLLGFFNIVFASLGALFLSLMMLFAVLVRIRIRDPLLLILPAFIYFALNLYIFISAGQLFLKQ